MAAIANAQRTKEQGALPASRFNPFLIAAAKKAPKMKSVRHLAQMFGCKVPDEGTQ